jgi:hypothetical protein
MRRRSRRKEREENTNVNGKSEVKRPREEDEEMADVDDERATKKAEEQATRAHAVLKRGYTSYATLDERFRSVTASGQEGCVLTIFFTFGFCSEAEHTGVSI